eukprot:428887_1
MQPQLQSQNITEILPENPQKLDEKIKNNLDKQFRQKQQEHDDYLNAKKEEYEAKTQRLKQQEKERKKEIQKHQQQMLNMESQMNKQHEQMKKSHTKVKQHKK